jgi:hypothetical protein
MGGGTGCDGGINKVQLRNSNSLVAFQQKYKGEEKEAR